MKSLQENGQYEFFVRLTGEWMIQENKAYDILSDISGKFVGSRIVLEQQKMWIAAEPKVVMEWLPNLQLENEAYFIGRIHIPRFLGLLLFSTKAIRSRWSFKITELK